MIGLRKLASLPDGTRMRKTAALIGDFERILAAGESADRAYWKDVLRLAAEDGVWPPAVRSLAAGVVAGTIAETAEETPPDIDIRAVNTLRHAMLSALGRNWADWDMASPGDAGRYGFSDPPGESSLPMRVYLDGLRSPFNVGSILRTSLAFGVERLWTSSDCAPPDHPRSRRSSMGASESVPWSIRDLESLTRDETGDIFALELGGEGIRDFTFPKAGTVVLGSEELGVSPAALRRAGDSAGVVGIALPGPKASLNVGVAFGILMYEWSAALRDA